MTFWPNEDATNHCSLVRCLLASGSLFINLARPAILLFFFCFPSFLALSALGNPLESILIFIPRPVWCSFDGQNWSVLLLPDILMTTSVSRFTVSLTGTEQETRAFMAACIETLRKRNDGPTPLFIFDQLCNIVCPAKHVADRLLVCVGCPCVCVYAYVCVRVCMETRAFMAACIETLRKRNDGPTPLFIFDQLCNIVWPAKHVADRLLVCACACVRVRACVCLCKWLC